MKKTFARIWLCIAATAVMAFLVYLTIVAPEIMGVMACSAAGVGLVLLTLWATGEVTGQ